MSHYKSNLRDIEFNLFEVQEIQGYTGTGPFEGIDADAAADILREIERLAREEFAASFTEADRTPLRLEDGEVTMAEGVKRSVDAVYDGDWHLLALPRELGGYGAPHSLRWACAEMLVGANPAAYLYVSGPLTARTIAAVGTDDQIDRFARPLVERRWGGTMVLTEPDAGSDVGAGTTKAVHIGADAWHLEGVKRFITSGEGDYYENIIHLVLARPEGGEPGTKGLSMFIVPKFLVDEDGSVGERNGIVATNIEKKMGIKGSATVELSLGMDRPCVGYLVGDVHDGIRQMFLVLEEARLLIGVKSASTLSTGYLNALEFARERVQSADLTEARDGSASRVPIIRHPDVRRMLMLQKSHAEGMRAISLHAAWTLDQAVLHPDDEYWGRLSDLLLPLVKGYCSEKGYELLASSLQVAGGSGFTQDYPFEQYIRDAKIDTIYEGTTGIQGLDLFFRKIVRDRGETLTRLGETMMETVKGGAEALADERFLLGKAIEDLQAQVAVMVGHAIRSVDQPPAVYKTGLHTTSLLETIAEVVIGWLLIRHAEVAIAARDGSSGADRAFYEGKVASARFFAAHALPKATLRRDAAEAEDGALMDLSLEAF